jgi:hypothetical protein
LRIQTRTIAVLIFFAAAAGRAAAAPDDHVAGAATRTYMGRTRTMPGVEFWVATDKMCHASPQITIIRRYDLGVVWTIVPRTKKYLEEPLPSKPGAGPSGEKTFRVQEYGFDYQPVFDWTISVSEEPEIVDGKSCLKVTAAGEADYASEVREFWVTRSVPIDLPRYFERVVEPDLMPGWRSLYEETPALREGLVLKSVTTTENAIAPTMISESKITLVESAAAPPGTYEIPAGFQKAKTAEDLWRQ